MTLPRAPRLGAAVLLLSAFGCRGPATPTGSAAEPIDPRQGALVVQDSHTRAVTAIALSPSGNYLATASLDGTVKIWEPRRRTLLRTLRHGRQNELVARPFVAWLDDRRVVLRRVGRGDVDVVGRNEIHDIETGAFEKVFPESDGEGQGVEGLHRAGGSQTRWLVGAGGCAIVDDGGPRCPPALFSPSLERLATPQATMRLGEVDTSRDGRVMFALSEREHGKSPTLLRSLGREAPRRRASTWWTDPARLTPVKLGELDADAPESFALAPEGDRVWVTTSGGARLLQSESLQEVCRTKGRARGGAFSPDGSVVVAQLGASLVAVDANTCEEKWSTAVRKLASLAFSDDGARLLVGEDDGALTELEARTGRFRGTFGAPRQPVEHGARAEHVVFPRPDLVLTTREATAPVSVWSLARAELTAAPRPLVDELPSSVSLLSVAHHVTALAGGDLLFTLARPSGCGEGKTQVVLSRRSPNAAFVPPDEVPRARAWPPGPGEDFAFCTSFGPILRLGTHAEGLMWAVRGPGDAPDDLAVFDLPTGQAKVLRGSGRTIEASFSRDGARLTAIWQDSALVWDTRRGATLATITAPKDDPGRAGPPLRVALSSNGAVAAVAFDRRVELCSITTRQTLAEVEKDATALTFGATDSELLVGDYDGGVSLYRDGKLVVRRPTEGGPIWSLVGDPSGARAASVSDDGSLRVWATKTAEPIAELVEFQDREWAVLTPGGAYHGTPEVSTRFGWAFPNPFEHFEADHFLPFDSAEAVRRRLRGASVSGELRRARPPRVVVAEAPTPVVSAESARFRVRASTLDSALAPVTVRAFVEGREAAAAPTDPATSEAVLEVPLRPGKNRVVFVAFTREGFASNEVVHDVESRRPGVARPDLWAVAVGVSRYPSLPERFQLPAAVNDARGLADLAGRLAGDGKLYAAAHVRLLEDEAVTRDAVRSAVDGLEAMKPNDVAIVLFAGHGIKPTDASDMVFLTGNVQPSASGLGVGQESVRQAGIGWRDLGTSLSRAKGRVLVLLDACHSGHVTRDLARNEELAGSLARDGRGGLLVFAAAKGREASLEPGTTRGLTLETEQRAAVAYAPERPHGFFTGAVLRAIVDPTTDRDHDGFVGASELVDEVTQRVTHASRLRQTPWVARRELFGDFALAPAAPCPTGTTWSPTKASCEASRK